MSDPIVTPQIWLHKVDSDTYRFHFDGKTLTLTGGPSWSTGVDSEWIFPNRAVRVSEMIAAMVGLWSKTYEWTEALQPVINQVIANPDPY